MVETRSRRKSTAAPATAATQPEEADTHTSGAASPSAQETINKYRQQYLQRRQQEQRNLWCRFVSWVRLRWYQYEMSYGPYMLDRWERLLVLAFIVSVMSLTMYGAYNVARRYALQ